MSQYVMIITDRNGYNHCCLIAGKLVEVPKSRLLVFAWPTKKRLDVECFFTPSHSCEMFKYDEAPFEFFAMQK